jgi:hypothetical protein
MRLTTLDTIVNGILVERGYPIHYYLQFLHHGSRAYEELHYDTLKNIKTIKLTVNSYKSIALPCDFMDLVKIGIPNGQFVKPLSKREGISRINNFDTQGNKIVHSQSQELGQPFGFYDQYFFDGYSSSVNDKGEFIGRQFGYGNGDNSNTYRYVPERNEIQLHEGISAQEIILQYITDGTSIDNATLITPYAKAAIEAYIIWKMKESNRTYSEGERERARQLWMKQHGILRGRLNPISKQDIFDIVRKNTHGSIKG